MRILSLSKRPLPLILASLLGVAGTCLLAYQVWHNQYLSVRTGLIQEQRQALRLLSADLESEIQQIVSQSLRYLFENDVQLVPGRIDALKKRFPALQQVMRFDAEGGMLYCIPGPSIIDDYRRWLSAELQHAVANRDANDLSTGSFLEEHEGKQVLFAFAPIPYDLYLGEGPGWIVLRYSLSSLLQYAWEPLKSDFIGKQGGSVVLRPILLSTSDTQSVQVPVTRYLSGWILDYQPDASRLNIIAQEQGLLLGLLILGLGSLPIAAGIVYWWYSRRDLLLARAKADFVAHVSHELKTPLSLIRMYAETLEMKRIKDPEKELKYLQTILKESDRLNGLIEQVLDYARMEGDNFQLKLQATDLAKTVSDLIETFRPSAEKKGFTLTKDIAPDLPDIPHDVNAVRHILLNLLDNAVKYSTDQNRIHINLQRQGNAIDLEVLDRGKGVCRDADPSLLQPFVRGPNEQNGQTAGAGLGLAVVCSAVKAHGGRFELVSRRGGGAVARVILPLTWQSEAAA